MIAIQSFIGVVGGVEKQFNVGDKITDAEAMEMALASKPYLATKEAKVAQPAKP
jgi:uridine phosphorylase